MKRMSGLDGDPRTLVALGVGSFLRITLKSTHVRIGAPERLNP